MVGTGPEGAARQLRGGVPIVLVDDRAEPEVGYLSYAADFADADAVNFMLREARGLTWLALTEARCEELWLEPMGARGPSRLAGAPMVSIEAREGVSTGISAADRARTIAVAIDPASRPGDLVRPGHVMPLRAAAAGLPEGRGAAEAIVELARLGDLTPAAAISEVLDDDGDPVDGAGLERFAAGHGLPLVRVTAVDEHRLGAPRPGGTTDEEIGRLMRTVMGHFATGVGVITVRGMDGGAVGTTANAISSVSLRPPLLLVCLATTSGTLAELRRVERFAINILATDQREHADRFALRGADARAHEVELEMHQVGVPVLADALAAIACRVEAIHPAGDHEIVIGRPLSLESADRETEPLIFYRGRYSRLAAT